MSCIYHVEEADLLVNAIDPIIVDGFVTISILGFNKKKKRKENVAACQIQKEIVLSRLILPGRWSSQLNGYEVLDETNNG